MSDRLVIDPHNASFDDLAPVARVLLDGGLVAFPTETFYALLVLVDNHPGLDRVVGLKGERERQHKPFLILMDQAARLRCYAREVREEAAGLMARFWPGPLTLLFPAQSGLHPYLVGSSRTVGLRVEGLPAVRRLVRMVDRGVTGTSANLSAQPPTTTADEVQAAFGDRIDLLVDGGPTPGGQPTTIIDVSLSPPRVIRDGALSRADLALACPALRFKSEP